MKVEIATKSIDKIKGIEEAFFRYLKTEKIEFSSYKVESGVSEQPFNAETYKGAFNRVNNLIDKVDDADFYISCEAGIEEFYGKYMNVQVVCIFDRKNKVYLWGKSSGWCIPDSDVERIKKNNIRIKTNEKKVDLNKVRIYTKVVIKFDKIFGGLR